MLIFSYWKFSNVDLQFTGQLPKGKIRPKISFYAPRLAASFLQDLDHCRSPCTASNVNSNNQFGISKQLGRSCPFLSFRAKFDHFIICAVVEPEIRWFQQRLKLTRSRLSTHEKQSNVEEPRILTACGGNWLRTITSDQISKVYDNSSLSSWTRRYDMTG